MLALISLLTIVSLSIVTVRIGAIALELTGLSPEVAGFQAQSAFSGTGFTTSEAETIVGHPVRRKIVRTLILIGGAGLTTTMATLILTFIGPSGETIAMRAGYLLIGLVFIFLMARSKWLYAFMKKVIVGMLSKSKALQIYDYTEILGIARGYNISKIKVKSDSWMIGQSLKDLKLHKEGTLILSIQKDTDQEHTFVGSPAADTVIEVGDVLTAYGRSGGMKCLSERTKIDGEMRHQKNIEIEQQTVASAAAEH